MPLWLRVVYPTKPIKCAAVGHSLAVQKRISVVVAPIHLRADAELAQVACALCALSRRFAFAERGKQQRRQQCNNRDHYQQLNQSETGRTNPEHGERIFSFLSLDSRAKAIRAQTIRSRIGWRRQRREMIAPT